jgi:hypothetical protein
MIQTITSIKMYGFAETQFKKKTFSGSELCIHFFIKGLIFDWSGGAFTLFGGAITLTLNLFQILCFELG